ncbi:MAG: 3'-5' exonuclease [Eubacteriales bacterium]
MNYIVLDLEWNQSNIGEEGRDKLLPFEIIEIGAVKLNHDAKMISKFSELVKPQVYHEMHHITGKLVHLQMDELRKGRVFSEVMSEFLEWCGEDYIFCTWGPLDLLELQRNMEYYQMIPLACNAIKFYDVQKLFSLAYEDEKTRKTLEYAVDYFKIEKDIEFHRAYSDAYYTGKVLEKLVQSPHIMEKVSFDTYHLPQTKKDEIKVVFHDYAKYISREFDEKAALLADREVISTKCYICHKNLKKKVKWFTPNGKHYYSISYCNIHGFMKSKIRIKKSVGDNVYAIKTSKFVEEKDVKEILARKRKIQNTKDKKKV